MPGTLREHRGLGRRWLSAVLAQRCPRCREGEVFSGILDMHRACPSCGHVFEREHGYFVGAMVVSYAIGVIAYGGLTLALWLGVGMSVELALVAGALSLIAAAPVIVRYSRVIWMYLDQALDPS